MNCYTFSEIFDKKYLDYWIKEFKDARNMDCYEIKKKPEPVVESYARNKEPKNGNAKGGLEWKYDQNKDNDECWIKLYLQDYDYKKEGTPGCVNCLEDPDKDAVYQPTSCNPFEEPEDKQGTKETDEAAGSTAVPTKSDDAAGAAKPGGGPAGGIGSSTDGGPTTEIIFEPSDKGIIILGTTPLPGIFAAQLHGAVDVGFDKAKAARGYLPHTDVTPEPEPPKPPPDPRLDKNKGAQSNVEDENGVKTDKKTGSSRGKFSGTTFADDRRGIGKLTDSENFEKGVIDAEKKALETLRDELFSEIMTAFGKDIRMLDGAWQVLGKFGDPKALLADLKRKAQEELAKKEEEVQKKIEDRKELYKKNGFNVDELEEKKKRGIRLTEEEENVLKEFVEFRGDLSKAGSELAQLREKVGTLLAAEKSFSDFQKNEVAKKAETLGRAFGKLGGELKGSQLVFKDGKWQVLQEGKEPVSLERFMSENQAALEKALREEFGENAEELSKGLFAEREEKKWWESAEGKAAKAEIEKSVKETRDAKLWGKNEDGSARNYEEAALAAAGDSAKSKEVKSIFEKAIEDAVDKKGSEKRTEYEAQFDPGKNMVTAEDYASTMIKGFMDEGAQKKFSDSADKVQVGTYGVALQFKDGKWEMAERQKVGDFLRNQGTKGSEFLIELEKNNENLRKVYNEEYQFYYGDDGVVTKKVKALQQEIEVSAAELEKLRARVEAYGKSAQRDIEDYQANLEAMTKKNEERKKKIVEWEKKEQELQQEIAEIQQRIQSTMSRGKDIYGTSADHDALQKKKTELENIRIEIRDAERAIRINLDSAQEASRRIKDRHSTYFDLKERLGQAELEHYQKASLMRASEFDLRIRAMRVESLDAKMSSIDEDIINRAKDQITELLKQAKEKSLTEEQKKQLAELEDKKKQYEDLAAEQRRLQHELSILHEKKEPSEADEDRKKEIAERLGTIKDEIKKASEDYGVAADKTDALDEREKEVLKSTVSALTSGEQQRAEFADNKNKLLEAGDQRVLEDFQIDDETGEVKEKYAHIIDFKKEAESAIGRIEAAAKAENRALTPDEKARIAKLKTYDPDKFDPTVINEILLEMGVTVTVENFQTYKDIAGNEHAVRIDIKTGEIRDLHDPDKVYGQLGASDTDFYRSLKIEEFGIRMEKEEAELRAEISKLEDDLGVGDASKRLNELTSQLEQLEARKKSWEDSARNLQLIQEEIEVKQNAFDQWQRQMYTDCLFGPATGLAILEITGAAVDCPPTKADYEVERSRMQLEIEELRGQQFEAQRAAQYLKAEGPDLESRIQDLTTRVKSQRELVTLFKDEDAAMIELKRAQLQRNRTRLATIRLTNPQLIRTQFQPQFTRIGELQEQNDDLQSDVLRIRALLSVFEREIPAEYGSPTANFFYHKDEHGRYWLKDEQGNVLDIEVNVARKDGKLIIRPKDTSYEKRKTELEQELLKKSRQMTENQKEMRQLNSEITTARNEELKETMDFLERTGELTPEMKNLIAEEQEILGKMSSLEDEMLDLETQLAEKIDEVSVELTEREAVKRKLDSLKNEMAGKEKELKATKEPEQQRRLLDELSALDKEITYYGKENQGYAESNAYDELKSKLKSKSEELAGLRTRLGQINQEKYNNLFGEAAGQRNSDIELNGRISELKAQFDAGEITYEQYNEKLNKLKEESKKDLDRLKEQDIKDLAKAQKKINEAVQKERERLERERSEAYAAALKEKLDGYRRDSEAVVLDVDPETGVVSMGRVLKRGQEAELKQKYARLLAELETDHRLTEDQRKILKAKYEQEILNLFAHTNKISGKAGYLSEEELAALDASGKPIARDIERLNSQIISLRKQIQEARKQAAENPEFKKSWTASADSLQRRVEGLEKSIQEKSKQLARIEITKRISLGSQKDAIAYLKSQQELYRNLDPTGLNLGWREAVDEMIGTQGFDKLMQEEINQNLGEIARTTRQMELDPEGITAENLEDAVNAVIDSAQLLSDEGLNAAFGSALGLSNSLEDLLDNPNISNAMQNEIRSRLSQLDNLMETYQDEIRVKYDAMMSEASTEQQLLIETSKGMAQARMHSYFCDAQSNPENCRTGSVMNAQNVAEDIRSRIAELLNGKQYALEPGGTISSKDPRLQRQIQ
ncbi:hypothetical protein KY335_04470 [Candidatus Woesearchaeota archaeon]|nr:hypothetical protein [Candidatus Woesearchaeota archaeon]